MTNKQFERNLFPMKIYLQVDFVFLFDDVLDLVFQVCLIHRVHCHKPIPLKSNICIIKREINRINLHYRALHV